MAFMNSSVNFTIGTTTAISLGTAGIFSTRTISFLGWSKIVLPLLSTTAFLLCGSTYLVYIVEYTLLQFSSYFWDMLYIRSIVGGFDRSDRGVNGFHHHSL